MKRIYQVFPHYEPNAVQVCWVIKYRYKWWPFWRDAFVDHTIGGSGVLVYNSYPAAEYVKNQLQKAQA